MLSSEEQRWIREIVSVNPAWADVHIGELFVVAECTCGCRSVVIEDIPYVQNPKLADHQGLVGEIDINIRATGKVDVVSVLLHYAKGNLSLLEVVWYNFPKPVPKSWEEISREVRPGD